MMSKQTISFSCFLLLLFSVLVFTGGKPTGDPNLKGDLPDTSQGRPPKNALEEPAPPGLLPSPHDSTEANIEDEYNLYYLDSIHFEEVHLRYSFQSAEAISDSLFEDFVEMASIHPGFSDTLLTGEITNLSAIMCNSMLISEESRRPTIYLTGTGVDPLTPWIIQIHSVDGNRLKNPLPGNSWISSCIVQIASARTSAHNLQLVWEKNLTTSSIDSLSLMTGIVPLLDESAFITSSLWEGDLLTYFGDDGELIIEDGDLENPDDVINLAPSSTSVFFPQALSGPVYCGGMVNQSLHWKRPIIYSIIAN